MRPIETVHISNAGLFLRVNTLDATALVSLGKLISIEELPDGGCMLSWEGHRVISINSLDEILEAKCRGEAERLEMKEGVLKNRREARERDFQAKFPEKGSKSKASSGPKPFSNPFQKPGDKKKGPNMGDI